MNSSNKFKICTTSDIILKQQLSIESRQKSQVHSVLIYNEILVF